MNYKPAVDGIRAVAVLMVIGFHSSTPGAAGGYLGVDVFFVLSGFLITTLLLDELENTGNLNLGQFYLRRFLRLTPALLLMLSAYLILAPLAWPKIAMRTDVRDVLISTLYLSDYASAFWSLPRYLRHTWSLSVEQHFYLLWPLLLLVLTKRFNRSQLAIALGALYVVFTGWRIYCDMHGDAGYMHSYYRFDTRLSGLTVGSLMAALVGNFNRLAAPRLANLAAMAGLAVIALCSWRFHVESTAAMIFGIAAVELSTLALIYVAVNVEGSFVQRALAHPLPTFIGKMSYGIYLWHYPIFVYLSDRYPWYEILIGGGMISLLLATASYYSIERFARQYARTLKTSPAASNLPRPQAASTS
jgi:peptidoglycan/LPS O-acetylase OafA/YrhL